MSSQSDRLPSLKGSGGQPGYFEDDANNDDDLHNGDQHSQHSKVPDWNNKIKPHRSEKVLIKGNSFCYYSFFFGWHVTSWGHLTRVL